jgi:hypothetical protein
MAKKYKLYLSGRKSFDGKDRDTIFTALIQAWTVGATDTEAAASAGISPATLSKHLKDNEELSGIKEKLKEQVILRARTTVYNAIGDNADMAMKFLERKRPDEFAPTTKNKIIAEIESDITKESIDEAKEVLKLSGITIRAKNNGQEIQNIGS